MARLSPHHILRPDPAAQIVPLADGRLLVRHRGGVSLLGGVSAAEVDAVLAAADGRRSAGEICRHLAAEHGEGRVRGLLKQLAGEVLHVPGEVPDEVSAVIRIASVSPSDISPFLHNNLTLVRNLGFSRKIRAGVPPGYRTPSLTPFKG